MLKTIHNDFVNVSLSRYMLSKLKTGDCLNNIKMAGYFHQELRFDMIRTGGFKSRTYFTKIASCHSDNRELVHS
jgi:hypothetical protein